MECFNFGMVMTESSFFWLLGRRRLGFVFRAVLGLWISFVLFLPANGLRPLREKARSWGDEWLFIKKDENELGPFSPWNITGTYKGTWNFLDSTNSSSRFPDFRKSNGNSIFELVSTPTKITGVHYVQGVIIFHDVYENDHKAGGAQIRVEGVYIWPFRQLRMVANSGKEGELNQEEEYVLSNPYHLLGVFSSQVFQESPRDKILRRKHSPIHDMEKHCNIEIAAQISRLSTTQNDGDRDRYHIEGLMESPSADDDGDCFSPLLLNATSVNIEVYYNKAVNYTLMVTFVSFIQVLLLIRQMEHSNTQSGAAKVSILMIGQQAIMDAYLCLLHLTAGILVGMYMGEYEPPLCSCGGGYMRLLRSNTSQNPERLFYKCPARGKIAENFLWFTKVYPHLNVDGYGTGRPNVRRVEADNGSLRMESHLSNGNRNMNMYRIGNENVNKRHIALVGIYSCIFCDLFLLNMLVFVAMLLYVSKK